ncbi:hypothetical protein N9D23_07570 [Rubripirellula sp.]|nr:hypothetical protein [Rubripirellula sp.]
MIKTSSRPKFAVFLIALGFIVLLAVVFRLVVLANVPQLENDLSAVKIAVTDWVHSNGETLGNETQENQLATQIDARPLPESLTRLGVVSVGFEQFDPNATVFIRPGVDGQPGVAGVDDNGNGIVDDDTELGATKTDDVLSVTAGEVDTEGPILILQRGGYVPVSRQTATSESAAWRAVVNGRSQGEGWSFLLPFGS